MDKEVRLRALHEAWSNCQGCMLCESRTKVVFGYGNPDAQVMIIGEAPGEKEDMYGVPFIGNAGMLLDQYLGVCSAREEVIEAFSAVAGKKTPEKERNEWRITLRKLLGEEFYFTNIVMCRPEDNRDPTAKEIAVCRARLLEQIYIIDPLYIIAAGKHAVSAVLGKTVSITQIRGQFLDVDFPGRIISHKRAVMPVLHPAYLLRKNDFLQSGGDTAKTKDDFLRVMRLVDAYNNYHWDIPPPKARPMLKAKRA